MSKLSFVGLAQSRNGEKPVPVEDKKVGLSQVIANNTLIP